MLGSPYEFNSRSLMAHVFFVGVAGASVQSQGQKNLHEDKRSTLCGPNLGKCYLARSTMATMVQNRYIPLVLLNHAVRPLTSLNHVVFQFPSFSFHLLLTSHDQ